jgi:hypothetical protein
VYAGLRDRLGETLQWSGGRIRRLGQSSLNYFPAKQD